MKNTSHPGCLRAGCFISVYFNFLAAGPFRKINSVSSWRRRQQGSMETNAVNLLAVD
jgi:hypothetical protein